MRLFEILVRFTDKSDYSIRFSSDVEASSYFEHLVKFELEGLLPGVWCIHLSHGKKTLRHYNNFLNVKHYIIKVMSQNSSNSQISKQMVIVVSRYGLVVGVYNKLDDALVLLQDYVVKGWSFDLSAKYVQ